MAISFLPQEGDDADLTRQAIEDLGGTCVMLPTDQRTEAANVQLAEQAVEQLGGIDVLINNAGYQMAQSGDITSFPEGQFEQVFTTNLFAAFWLTKAVVASMSAGVASSTPPRFRHLTLRTSIGLRSDKIRIEQLHRQPRCTTGPARYPR
nr:SDR family NAD(P)-dependent oxidoreductase [Ornithinimicrobium sp. INDO-MA30-4]